MGASFPFSTRPTHRTGFVAGIVVQIVTSLAVDRATWRRGGLRASLRRMGQLPPLQREIWDQLRAYDRRGFHPDDRETSALVAEWPERLFGAEGSRNDRLVEAAA